MSGPVKGERARRYGKDRDTSFTQGVDKPQADVFVQITCLNATRC